MDELSSAEIESLFNAHPKKHQRRKTYFEGVIRHYVFDGDQWIDANGKAAQTLSEDRRKKLDQFEKLKEQTGND